MSTDETTPAADVWRPLPPLERRVLGVLVEKQKTSRTADAYPMTLNSITIGCNQKSNRDPVMDLTEDQVEETLSTLQKSLLVQRVTGSRVDRFRHMLYENWTSIGKEMAVLAELLLRGAQTKGDLRGRASRMEPIDTMEALDEVLRPLVERKLVAWLSPPDRRGSMLTHGFHTAEELSQARTYAANVPENAAPATRTAASSGLESKLNEALAELASLRERVAALEQKLG